MLHGPRHSRAVLQPAGVGMTLALLLPFAPFLAGLTIGPVLRRYDKWKSDRQREFNRVLRFPSVLARVEPTPWPTPLSPRLHERVTLEPPAPAPSFRAELDGHIEPAPAREQVIHIYADADDHGCPMPCTAKHCIYHANIVGTINQRYRWNTDTQE